MTYILNHDHIAQCQNERIQFLVFHYTAQPLEKALATLSLANKQVSAHYLVPESPVSGKKIVYQLVAEEKRAWHAGMSYWKTHTHLNDSSIGIELVNLGFEEKSNQKIWFPYTEYQIELVINLSKSIIKRYNIHPSNVIGHSDIAPGRKFDPGPAFPWKILAENGVGVWPIKEQVDQYQTELINWPPIAEIQRNFKAYGYQVEETGVLDKQTEQVILAFQMHFRPSNYQGVLDKETYARLLSLLTLK